MTSIYTYWSVAVVALLGAAFFVFGYLFGVLLTRHSHLPSRQHVAVGDPSQWFVKRRGLRYQIWKYESVGEARITILKRYREGGVVLKFWTLLRAQDHADYANRRETIRRQIKERAHRVEEKVKENRT